MADEGGSGGGGIAFAILIILIVLVVNVPLVSEIIFQWIPATISVVSGEPAFPSGVSGTATTTEDSSEEPTVLVTSSEEDGGNLAISEAEDDTVSVYETGVLPAIDGELFSIWNALVPVSIFLSLIFGMGILYAIIRVSQIRKQERTMRFEDTHPVASKNISKAQLRWQDVLEQSQSDNPNDWRLAILEADIMLDELLDIQGYKGDTMGEKMKQVEVSDFRTIDAAWEAHKSRNKIAHEGSDFELNQREVRRIVELYERVFREFHFI